MLTARSSGQPQQLRSTSDDEAWQHEKVST